VASAVAERKIASHQGFYGLILDNVLSESCKYDSLSLSICIKYKNIKISMS
jgi:hypothetical protein